MDKFLVDSGPFPRGREVFLVAMYPGLRPPNHRSRLSMSSGVRQIHGAGSTPSAYACVQRIEWVIRIAKGDERARRK